MVYVRDAVIETLRPRFFVGAGRFWAFSSFLFYQLCDHIADLSEPLGASPRFYKANASVSVDQNRGGSAVAP
jgi:hypothetical protein